LNANEDLEEADEFDNQLHRREQELNRIREALQRTNEVNYNA
jgi:FtsZ-binding cell division protein ZapB